MKKTTTLLIGLLILLPTSFLQAQTRPDSVQEEPVLTSFSRQFTAHKFKGAHSKVNATDFQSGNVHDIFQLLQGMVPGLMVSRVGNDPNVPYDIRLKSLNTLREGNPQPLIVVDDMPGVSLLSVDPHDVASVTVLRDAAAAAIYGIRGAGGVLEIETKKGSYSGQKINYHGYLSVEKLRQKFKPLEANEYLRFAGSQDEGSTTNWLDEITRTGLSQVHSLSLNGNNNRTRYRASVNLRDVQGLALKSGFKQVNGRFALRQQAMEGRLRVQVNMGLTHRKSELVPYEAFYQSLLYNPTAPIFEDNPLNGGYYQRQVFGYFNPKAIVDQEIHDRKFLDLWLGGQATYQLLNHLTLNGSYTRQWQQLRTGDFYPQVAYRIGRDRDGLAELSSRETLSEQVVVGLQYQQSFGRATDILFKGGYAYQGYLTETLQAQGGGFLIDQFRYHNLLAASDFARGNGSVTSGKSAHRLAAVYGQLFVEHDRRFFLNINFRQEGSSRLGENTRWGSFPGITGGVALHRWLRFPGLNQLRLRAGWGKTGRLPTSGLLSQALWSPLRYPAGFNTFGGGGAFPINGEYALITRLEQSPNPDLKWEETRELTIGLDVAWKNSRWRGMIELYQRNTTDIIQIFNNGGDPAQLGAFRIYRNLGDIKGGGIDLSLTGPLVRKENFRWDLNLVYSRFFTTTLTRLNDQEESFFIGNQGAPGPGFAPWIRIGEGDPLGQIWGFHFERINDQGEPVYTDLNGNGAVNIQDTEAIGNAFPKSMLGLQQTLSGKHLSLRIMLRGMFGHDIVNAHRFSFEKPVNFGPYNAVHTRYYLSNLRGFHQPNDLFVEKGNFLRLDYLELAYTVPPKKLKGISSMKVYLNVRNLFTISRYTGDDPELRLTETFGPLVRQFGDDPLVPGIDRPFQYPYGASWTLGVQVGL